MATKHSATKDEEQLPVQIYNILCCFNTSTLAYAAKGNGLRISGWRRKKVMSRKKSSKEEPDTERKKMFSQSEHVWTQRLAIPVDTV